jgi:hypothetical protein
MRGNPRLDASVEAYLTERSRLCGENRDRFRKDNDEERHRDLDGPHDGLFGLLINQGGLLDRRPPHSTLKRPNPYETISPARRRDRRIRCLVPAFAGAD